MRARRILGLLVLAVFLAWLPGSLTTSPESASLSPSPGRPSGHDSPAIPSRPPISATTPEEAELTPTVPEGPNLSVLVVDHRTGDPVPGVEVILQSWFDPPFDRGQTDSYGLVGFAVQERGSLQVCTGRHPPFTLHVEEVDFDPAVGSHVELRLTTGTRVRGQVVDDTGAPVAGARVIVGEVWFDDLTRHLGLPVQATTGPDGVYHIEAFPVPDDSDELMVPIRADRGLAESGTTMSILAGSADHLAPDIIMIRSVTLGGSVVDAAEVPVPGVVVSRNPDRWVSTVRKGQEVDPATCDLLPGEARTDPDGRFSIDAEARSSEVLVFTGGAPHRFDLPGFLPGERRDDLRLRVPARCRFLLDITLPAGFTFQAPPCGWNPLDAFRVRGELANGILIQGQVSLPPKEFAVTFGCSASALVAFQIEHPECPPVRVVPDSPLEDGDLLRARLSRPERFPIPLQVVIPDSNRPPEKQGATVKVAACRSPEPDRGPHCQCGLGDLFFSRSVEGYRTDVDLTVHTREPYWIQVFWSAGWKHTRQRFGPFSPRRSRITLELRSRWIDSTPVRERTPDVHGTIRLVLRDRDTHRFLTDDDDPWILVMPEDGAAPYRDLLEPSEDGSHWIGSIACGRVRIRCAALAYESSPSGPLDIGPETLLDLGTIPMRPLPRFRARIVDARGRALSHGASIQLGHAYGPVGYRTSEKQWEFPVSPEGDFKLWVRDHGHQILDVRGWNRGPAPHLRLSAWTTIDLHPQGLAPTHRRTSISFKLEKVEDESFLRCGSPWPLVSEDGGSRRFRVRLGAGRYVIRGSNALYDIPPISLEIDGSGGHRRVDVPMTLR